MTDGATRPGAPGHLSSRERRIHDRARAVIAKLKKTEVLALRGGTWELLYDFAKTARLVWNARGGGRAPFAIIPDRQEIKGIGPLRFSYAERKLIEAQAELKTPARNRPAP
jgi:hypothetical protein